MKAESPEPAPFNETACGKFNPISVGIAASHSNQRELISLVPATLGVTKAEEVEEVELKVTATVGDSPTAEVGGKFATLI